MKRIDVGILGATGTVGQQFVRLLADHPWFRLTWLAASEQSAGKLYGSLPWRLAEPRSPVIADLRVQSLVAGRGPALMFSALDASVAGEAEAAFAVAGHTVVSNARNFRMDPLVPLLVPEINPDHLNLLARQKSEKKWSGMIVTNPNCSTVFLAMALGALRTFQPTRVIVTTLQALSGAGYPGVASLDTVGNVVPLVVGEEEKLESEPQKILGDVSTGAIIPHTVVISSQTTRVPVINGHTETVSVELAQKVSREEILTAFRDFSGEPQSRELPSAPTHPIICREEEDRPQPRLDADLYGGMVVQIGRLRPCPVLGWKFILLGHNTIRGAAGAALLNAELMAARKLL